MLTATMRALLLASVVLLTGAWTPASAQVLGVFRWQMQPYCNVVTFTVIQQGSNYQLTGNDSLCGAPAWAPATGTATPNPDGSISLGFNIVLPSGATANVSANVSLATVSGSWSDADGNTGPFLFNPPAVGGPTRPEPTRSVLITSAQLAASIFAGTGSATTVARSDHTHDDRYYTEAETNAVVAGAGAVVIEEIFATPSNLTFDSVHQQRTVVTPKAGRLIVNFAANVVTLSCNPSGSYYTFITVDGTPIRNSIIAVGTGGGVAMVTGITPDIVPAGSHDIRVGSRCFSGSVSSYTWFSQPRVAVAVLP